jgi:hypothetical protein
MQIKLDDLKKLKELSESEFDRKFKQNGLDKNVITRDLYEELYGVWNALINNATTPDEYYEKMVVGTYLPGGEKIIN